MRLSILIMLMALTACTNTSVKEADKTAWQAFGYQGMAEKINQLAGPNSFNCGIHNYLEPNDPVNKHMSPDDSRACIKQSIQSKTPLRYGSVRIPIDSFLFDALVLSEEGEFWLIRYDIMVDGTDNRHFIDRCKSVAIDYYHMSYEGVNCQPVSSEKWLADFTVK